MEIEGTREKKTRQFSERKGREAQPQTLSPVHTPQGLFYLRKPPFSNVYKGVTRLGAVLKRIKASTEVTSVKTGEQPCLLPTHT